MSRREGIASCLYSVLTILMIIGMAATALFLCSCRTIKEVPVEKVVEKIKYVDKTKIDSIYQHDSIYIKATGDTIYEFRDKYIYKYEFIHDTLYISKIDSIPYTIYVDKPQSRIEQLQTNLGGFAILVLIFVVIGYVIRYFISHTK